MHESSGNNNETCRNDRYGGSSSKPMGKFCKELWLSPISWRWNYQVRLDLFNSRIDYLLLCIIFVHKPSDNYLCRIQPVYVVDVASAIVAALRDGSSMGKVYELGGPDIFTVHELVALCSVNSLSLLPLFSSFLPFFLSFYDFLSRTCSLTLMHSSG